MNAQTHQQVVLASRPTGIPQAEHFSLVSAPRPTLDDGEIVVKNIYLSVEPAMRGWLSDAGNYSAPIEVGSVMRAFTTGQIVESRNPDYVPGDYVTGLFGWQEYAAVDGATVIRTVSVDRVPLSTSLGILGLNGITAYFGLLESGQPQSGETVVVSTAAGAVGSAVGQIAKLKGCRTIGITGGAEKLAICLEEFGFEQAVDYKSDSFKDDLLQTLESGVDVYFDNTAGVITDAVMTRLNQKARIVICGTASISEWDPLPTGPRINRQLLVARARIEGFLVLDYASRYPEAVTALENWIVSGELKYREDILQGIEHAPDGIAGLYRGENMGKRLIQIADAPVTGGASS